jgi:hypothetical protein
MVLALLALPAPARAQSTDLLLVLAADVSRSIDESEFALQREGYSAALTDPRVLAAIRGGSTGTIAICFVEWSGAGEQNVVADWTVIHDEEEAGGLAAAILAAPRSFMGRTSISGAIDFAMERFAAAQPRANRRIIDISGDGTDNSGRPVTEARDQALEEGDNQRARDRQRQTEPGLCLPYPAARRSSEGIGRMHAARRFSGSSTIYLRRRHDQ